MRGKLSFLISDWSDKSDFSNESEPSDQSKKLLPFLFVGLDEG